MRSTSTTRTTRWAATGALVAAVATMTATVIDAAAAVPPPPPDASPVTVQAGQTTSGIDVTLHPLTSFGTITGRVVDAGTSTVPDGETVLLVTPSGERVNHQLIDTGVNPDGSFELTAPPSAKGYAICFLHVHGSAAKRTPYSQCLHGGVWNEKAPRSGARLVPLSDGQTVNLGKLELKPSARITGTITAPDGKPLVAAVWAQSISHPSQSRNTASGIEGHPGHFVLGRLAPSPKGYVVCFAGQTASEPSDQDSATGYLGICHGGALWEGGPRPADVTPVHVVPGGKPTEVDAVLPEAGSIVGTVTAHGSGRVLHHTNVTVFDHNGHKVLDAFTAGRHGVFHANGLLGGRYYVCASARYGDRGTHSYFGHCLHGQQWTRGEPPNGRLVSVTRGAKTEVHVPVSRAATIKGQVTKPDGKAVKFGEVYVYDSSGKLLEQRETDAKGFYNVLWLSPAPDDGYFVCAVDDNPAVRAPRAAPGCYSGAAWDGPPATVPNGAKPVQVQAGQTTSGIDFALPAGGSISGTMTGEGVTSKRFASDVVLFDRDGTELQRSPVFPRHPFEFDAVAPGQGYRVCVESTAERSSPSGPGHKYLGECYTDASWNG